MTLRDSGRAEVIEEALMSSVSPFSRPMSSDDVNPVIARLSQNRAAADAGEHTVLCTKKAFAMLVVDASLAGTAVVDAEL